MRFPSIKTLMALASSAIDLNAIKTARIIGTANSKDAICKLSTHADEYVSRALRPSLTMARMTALNQVLGMHGVESIETVNGALVAFYLNAGDTYNPTVIKFNGHYRVQTLGDFIEIMQRQGMRFK